MPASAGDRGRRLRGRAVQLGVALGLTALALATRMAIDPALGRELPYVTFFVVVAVTASLVAPAAGVFAATLGCVVGKWFFIEPRHALLPRGSADWFRMASFLGVSAVFIGLVAFVSRARERSARDEAALEHETDVRRRVEERLRASDETLRLAREAAGIGVWSWDLATGELSWTDTFKALIALPPGGDVSYERFMSAIHPDDRERVDRVLKEALERREDYDTEMRVPWPDGSVRWVAARGRAFFDASGHPSRVVGMVLDVTDRKHREEALRDADARKTEFLAVLSHELRNPLAPIRNAMYLLDRVAPDGPQAARAKEVVRRQTEQLSRLVDDLLDATRVSQGKIRLQREQLDVRSVVRRTCEDHQSMFDHAGVDLRLDFPAGPVWVDADPTRIAQVVGNLLQNAGKFTPAHGVVSVALRARGRLAEIRVKDTGIGFEQKMVERLFEPFAQEERGLVRTRGGLGLGLALAKGLLALHGGAISASSDGAGRGAEFVVTLPLVEPAPRSVPGAGAGLRPATPARRVVVIEDNVDAAQTLAQVLELEGHEVHLARDGRGGIALARELKPDVVICDIGLPDVDGYAVARALRSDGALRATRLVALSGYAQPEDRERTKEAGFDAHLAKPSSMEDVLSLLS